MKLIFLKDWTRRGRKFKKGQSIEVDRELGLYLLKKKICREWTVNDLPEGINQYISETSTTKLLEKSKQSFNEDRQER